MYVRKVFGKRVSFSERLNWNVQNSRMCQKSGVINYKNFDNMVDIIAHRGLDGRGTFYENNLALGYRRLAIILSSREKVVLL